MSERDFYFMHLPQIAELIAECQRMTEEGYGRWKKETLEEMPIEAAGFMEKVFAVADRYSGHGAGI